MAGLLDTTTISTVLNQAYEAKLSSQINRACVITQVIPVIPGVGKNVAWDVRFTNINNAGAISDGSSPSLTSLSLDSKVPATLQFSTYNDWFGVTGRAISAAANSGGPDALIDLFEEELMQSAERVAAKINSELYTGTGATGPETIAGLTSVALLATGSYAGIYRTGGGTNYTEWKANLLSNGGVPRALSLQLMRDLKRIVYVASGQFPDLYVCDPIQFENYGLLLGSNRRYNQVVTVRGQTITLDGGFMSLDFDGVPLIMDKDCPAGNFLALNTSQMALRYLPDAASAVSRSNRSVQAVGSPEAQYGAMSGGLPVRVQPLAVNGDAYNFQLLTYPQLQVKRPNAFGVLSDLL